MRRERKRQSAEDVMKLFKQLSASEQARFVRLLKGGVSGSDDMEEYLTEQRFSDGRGGDLQRHARSLPCRECWAVRQR